MRVHLGASSGGIILRGLGGRDLSGLSILDADLVP